MRSSEVKIVTPAKERDDDNLKWLNENDYKKARQNIAKSLIS